MKKLNRVPDIKLMQIAELIANEYHSGHYSLFTFTTNVKFSFGTISDRDDIYDLEPYTDVNILTIQLVISHNN
jgi:hypothetical protein